MSWSLYVHVPWCTTVCPYCAFFVSTEQPDGERYADRLLDELQARRSDFPGSPETVYFGGGTPSRLSDAVLARLVRELPQARTVTAMEANPEDLSADRIERLVDMGFDRLSLGVQTLHPRHAKRLGRANTLAQANAALAALQHSRLSSWSADLIFGIPGQQLHELDEDLDALLAYAPPHVSLYGLTIEPGTPFHKLAQRGRFRVLEDDAWRAQYERIVSRLQAEGIERYEVSNFARPGHESPHNQGYWSDRAYLGLGPSAHSYAPDGRRWHNLPDIAKWLEAPDPRVDIEPASPERLAIDYVISGMRGIEGIDTQRLEARTGLTLRPSAIQVLESHGAIRRTPHGIALDSNGFPIADAVISKLVDALEPLE